MAMTIDELRQVLADIDQHDGMTVVVGTSPTNERDISHVRVVQDPDKRMASCYVKIFVE